MTKIELPYLWLPLMRGKQKAFYRRAGRTFRIRRLDGKPLLPGDAGFVDAYNAIHRDFEAAPAPRDTPAPGSLAALIAAYRASPEWRDLKPGTRETYERVLYALSTRFGHLPVATVPRGFIGKLKDEYGTKDGEPTPRRANYVVAIFRRLMSFAVDRGWRTDNPALKPGRLKTGPGYRAWNQRDVATFLEHPGIDETLKRALLLGLCTGQRKGDCLRMLWSARRDGGIEIVQEKTEARVWIPEHPDLSRALDAAPRTAATMLTRADGQPWKVDHFNHAFTAAAKLAGLHGLTFHGLRKAAASRLAEAGCSAHVIQAITGHATLAMVAHYTAEADRKRLARSAMAKLRQTKTE